MAKRVKCPNKDCKEKVVVTIPEEMTLYPDEKIYCGMCGAEMPIEVTP